MSSLLTTDAIRQFWGYDVNGNAVIGSPVVVQMKDGDGALIDAVATEEAPLNAAPVADVIGSVVYPCTLIEMRLAQANYESWAWFMHSQKPQLAARIGLPSPFANGAVGFAGVLANRPNSVNDSVNNALLSISGDANDRAVRMYEFVRGYADEYMGRKFVVGMPFILEKLDPETLKVTTNWEVTDGGYVEDGVSLLGLSPLNADTFRSQDGRFRSLMVFGNIQGVDLSKVSPQGTVIENGLLYQECQIDPQLVMVGGTPCVVASLNGPVVERELQPQGDPSILGWLFQVPAVAAMLKLKRTALPLKVAPAVRYPAVAAVPLKSNTLTYGPWYASGAPGKVRFEQAPSLTPWSYGGTLPMSLAGAARVTNAITNMQVCETGSIEVAGLPGASLGDVLQAGGPNITGMNVNVSTNGVKTNYRFQTFTPRFGVVSKGQAERMKRLGLANMELRRGLRASLREGISADKARGDAARANKAWRSAQAKALKKETPHDVFHAFSEIDFDGAVRTHPGMTTMEESVALANADSPDDYSATAIMSLGGLVRPFSTGFTSQVMPSLKFAPEVDGAIPSKTTLNPWKGRNDIEVFSYGQSYNGLHAYRRGVTGEDARVFGLRGPLVLVGWGFDTDTNCVPGDGMQWDLAVFNHSNVEASGNILAGYVPTDNRWYIFPVGGAGGGSGIPGPSGEPGPSGASIMPGTGILPIASSSYPGESEYYAREDHVHEHPVFDTGNLHPEYNVAFPTGSFREAGFDPRLVIPRFGEPVAIGTGNKEGSEDTFARSDHEHEHGEFDDGNYHPEYNLAFPTGSFEVREFDPKDVLPIFGGAVAIGWTNGSGESPEFARADHVHEHPTFASGDLHPEYNVTVSDTFGNVVEKTREIEFDSDYAMAVEGSGGIASVWVEEMRPSGPGAKRGLVPTPPSSSGNKVFLREDGVWAEPSGSSGGDGGVSPSGWTGSRVVLVDGLYCVDNVTVYGRQQETWLDGSLIEVVPLPSGTLGCCCPPASGDPGGGGSDSCESSTVVSNDGFSVSGNTGAAGETWYKFFGAAGTIYQIDLMSEAGLQVDIYFGSVDSCASKFLLAHMDGPGTGNFFVAGDGYLWVRVYGEVSAAFSIVVTIGS